MKRAAAIVAVLAGGLACRTAPPATPREPFLLDPRMGLAGPFSRAVSRGCDALLEGDLKTASDWFSREQDSSASRVGSIDLLLLRDDGPGADGACRALFNDGIRTAPALTACGEAAARQGRWDDAYDLFEAALLRDPEEERIEQLKSAAAPHAADLLVDTAGDALADEETDEAEQAIARAIELRPADPEVLALGARIAEAGGNAPLAWHRISRAAEERPRDKALAVKAADLSFALGHFESAARYYARLASTDPSFAEKERESREEQVISNWAAPERDAAHSARLSRAQLLTLVWKLVPEIRDVSSAAPSPVATDILLRPDQDVLAHFARIGLLTVDPGTHRAHPDGFVSRSEAAAIVLRTAALASLTLPEKCPESGDPLGRAVACGLLAPGKTRGISGGEFRSAIAVLRRTREGH